MGHFKNLWPGLGPSSWGIVFVLFPFVLQQMPFGRPDLLQNEGKRKKRYPLDGQAVDLQSHEKQWVQEKEPQWVYFGVYFGYTSRYTSENYIRHSAKNSFGRFFWLQTATARAPANGFAWKFEEMISEFRSIFSKHQNANPDTYSRTFWLFCREKHCFFDDCSMFLTKTGAQNVINE